MTAAAGKAKAAVVVAATEELELWRMAPMEFLRRATAATRAVVRARAPKEEMARAAEVEAKASARIPLRRPQPLLPI
jgi:hypothetical protein